MKLLKLLNKKNLSILISFFFLQNSYSTEPVDIWDLEKQSNQDTNSKNETIQNENLLPSSIFNIQNKIRNETSVDEEENLLSKNINIAGIYDPSDNDLSMEMWINSDGSKILENTNKIKKITLSKDASEILNIALLTNSYFPEKNINKEQFLKIKSDWLIKQKNLDLIETYVEKNKNLENQSKLIKYYIDYYLSKSDLGKACSIFEKINFNISDEYISKFNIYCLINSNKSEEAQLFFDLLKEQGFEDNFFEKKFAYLIGYDENIDNSISENTLLDFHLSHRTNSNFKFEPKSNTSKLIWKYLSSSNLLENIDFIDLKDQEKVFMIEKATHEKNYEEKDLFELYKRFQFNIDQLLNVKQSYKFLQNFEGRALLYQRLILTKDTEELLDLSLKLKESFIKDGIENAFDEELKKILSLVNEEEIPSNFSLFYIDEITPSTLKEENIKINNKIIHQSKLLKYFEDQYEVKKAEDDLNKLFKSIKKNKDYNVSIKDLIMVESLISDGVLISKKYKNMFKFGQSNVPTDIQLLLNNNESGMVLLRLVEIIGEDDLESLDPDTLYFIISILNQLNLDSIRNEILLKVLPLKI